MDLEKYGFRILTEEEYTELQKIDENFCTPEEEDEDE